ncbi:MAG: hypothetical protein CMJ58_05930 [Planctomycetaceae bacterium]|nr:hypothetical protein [Planctomycetaceae bacterium]
MFILRTYWEGSAAMNSRIYSTTQKLGLGGTFRRIVRTGTPAIKLGLLVAAAGVLSASPANGQLAHRYSFTTDASDSVGGANGTVVDAGTTANFAFTAGALDFSANTGEPSNAIVENAYLDLPNGIVSSAAAAGVSGAVAFEWWATVSETRTWQRLGDFGSSDGGEDASTGGGGVDYLMMAANSGRAGDGIEITNHVAGAEPAIAVTTGATPVGVPQHVLAVYNHNDPRGFTPQGANGTMTLYVNGDLVGYAGVHPNMDLNTFNDVNNWLGRSQWPDPLFDGSYDEFRIYNTAPSPAYAAASFAAGPDSLASFQAWEQEFDMSFVIDRDTGEMTLSNNDSGSIDVVYINITSASGALVPANWLSVTDNYDSDSGGSFDPNDTWSIEVSTNQELSEVELSGNGGQLGGAGTQTSIQLGAAGAWTLSSYEDVVVSVQRLLPDGVTIDEFGVPVTYINGIDAAGRSDLDIDGDVDSDDWIKFAANHLDDWSGLTVAAASVLGDIDGNLVSDVDDFRLFQTDYDAANGAGALMALIGAVPEPSAAAAAVVLATMGIAVRRRRSFRAGAKACSLMAACVVATLLAAPTARAALSIENGTFEVGIPDEVHQADVASPWFDFSGANFWENAWQISIDGISPNDTAVLALSAFAANDTIDGAGQNGYAYQNIGTADGETSVTITFDWGSFDDAGGPRDLGLTFSILESDGTFVPDNAIDVLGATGVTLIDQMSTSQMDVPVSGGFSESWTFDLSSAGSGDLYLRLNNFEPVSGQDQTWLYVDNIRIPGPTLTLVVDETTGNAKIVNQSTIPLSFDYYTIESAGDALKTSTWNSLADQGVDASLPADFDGSGTVDATDLAQWSGDYGANGDSDADSDGDSDGADFLAWQTQVGQSPGPADGWLEAGKSGSSRIGELFLTGLTTLGPGEELDLGAPYDPSVLGVGNGDLVFQYSEPGGPVESGTIAYGAGGVGAVPEPAAGALALTLALGTLLARGSTRIRR